MSRAFLQLHGKNMSDHIYMSLKQFVYHKTGIKEAGPNHVLHIGFSSFKKGYHWKICVQGHYISSMSIYLY